ncbi:hypothetical protein KUCAC02_021025, partial [Chaenocephalus aceratus]
LSFARALRCLSQQPQQDSIKPCASCVIPTSCTQGRECSAVFVCRGRPVSSLVPVSQPSRTGKPKNIQLVQCEQQMAVLVRTSVKSQTVTRKQTVAENFSFKQSALETPIKVVEKGGYCFLKISADVQ